MWTCPCCFVEMIPTSRYGHLKNKQGCSEQHALFLAEEAKKKEEVKKRNMAFFRPRAPARESAETAVGPPKAPKSTGANLGNQGALNSNLGSVSGLMESMVQYFDKKFDVLHRKLSPMKSSASVDNTPVGSQARSRN